MKLLSSPASPFGSKVKLTIAALGLSDRIDIEMIDTLGMNAAGQHPNPLGKIPCLIKDDGTAVFDSTVICDSLARLAGADWLVPDTHRETVLIQHAAATGMTEAALLVVYEGRMRDKGSQSAPWLAMQHQKITQTLDWFVDAPPVIEDQPSLAAIALAAALGYLDLRFEGVWRDSHPILVEWLAEFTRVLPAYEATKPRAAH